LKIAQLQAKLNEKESKPKSKPPTPPVFGSPGPNVDGPGPMPPGFQPSNSFNPPRTNVPLRSTLNRPQNSSSFKNGANGFRPSNLRSNPELLDSGYTPLQGEAGQDSVGPQFSIGQRREMANLRNAMLKLERENQKQKLLIQKLQKDKK